jgi:tRNA A-37 threonylcarbamoyl transferase component Bud32/tetratricopeptide (TPR) repeat protein
MDPLERARRARELFETALETDPAGRAELLERACATDPELRAEVEELLASLDDLRTDELLPPLLPAPVPPSPAGAQIGPYRILREIAEGGMGVVYLAERDDVGKRVALKLAREGRLASSAQLERFLRERRLLARLEHPGIARLMDAGMTEHRVPYLVMEYVEGVPIDAFCDARRLPVEERLRLFARVCEAVAYAHRHRVVHRDLKPSNILVTDAGEVKLLDFGIAKLLEDRGAGAPTLTVAGLVVATPRYASPEQIRGLPVREASDVYSLGVVLYELLCGHPPYRLPPRVLAEIERVVCTVEPEPPSAAAARTEEVPGAEGVSERISPERVSEARGTDPARLRRQLEGGLDAIVLKALEKEPRDRYSSVPSLVEDVRRHLGGLPARAGAAGRLERARRWTRRHRRLAAPAPLAMAAAVGALLLAVAVAPLRPGAGAEVLPEPASGAVAVFPFTVRGGGGELDYLREGLAELLGRGLDGAGDLHGVDPRAVLRRARAADGPPIDPGRGREIAARLGAGLFVLGEVTGSGERLRIGAALYEVGRTAAPISRAEAEGSAAEVFALADRLAAGLLADRFRAPAERLTRTAVLTTSSLPALKAYLEGEHHWREARYNQAVEAFQRAVREDSAFALAHYRMSAAATSTTFTELSRSAAEAAVRHGGRLSPRDRLLVEANLAKLRVDADLAESRFREILYLYPEDVHAATELADLLFHHNPFRGRSVREARAGFQAALDAGSRSREAVDHGAKLAALERDHAGLDAMEAHARELSPRDPLLALIPFLRTALLGTRAEKERAVAGLRPIRDLTAFVWYLWVGVFTRDLEATGMLAREMLAPERAVEVRAAGHLALADLALAQGRRGGALGELPRAARLAPLRALEVRGAYLSVPFLPASPEELRAARDTLERWDHARSPAPVNPPFPEFAAGTEPVARLYVLGLLSARLLDFDAAARYAAELERLDGPESARAYARDLAHGVRARAAQEQGRPDRALAALERIRLDWPRDYTPVHFNSLGAERFLRAELLLQLGRDEEALAWYETIAELSVADFVYLAHSHLRQGEIRERLGDPAAAAEHYARFVELWRDADPELRPLRVEAERRLAGLR